MMSNNDKSKKDGEHILSNYKRQLAEKMAREKANKGDMSVSSKSSQRSGKMTKKHKMDDDDDIQSKGGDFGQNEPPEPEVLLSILHRRSKI